MKDSSRQGILYCAIGKEYYKQASCSFQSVLKQKTKTKATIFTDWNSTENIWDRYIKPTNFQPSLNPLIYKLESLLLTPYEKTIFLDTDTIILDDITEIFLLLDRFDLVLCHGHNRQRRFNLLQNATSKDGKVLFSKNIPYCFAPLQSGLIAYNIKEVKDLFTKYKNMYITKEYFDDQAILREMLWESNLRFYILPPEFNFNSMKYIKTLKKSNYNIALPKIFHYTQNKNDSLKKLIRKIEKIQKKNILRLETIKILTKKFLYRLGILNS
jgi:hypothetical protein